MLAVSTSLSSISAQTGIPVNADGSYVVANDDGAPIVEGGGDDIVVGEVSTGGARWPDSWRSKCGLLAKCARQSGVWTAAYR